MRTWVSLLLVMATAGQAQDQDKVKVDDKAGDKLSFDDRVEIVRGLMAEYATLKAYLPQSKKPLAFESTGKYDAKEWEESGKKLGPAARTGDLIQITKVTLEHDRILL